MTQTKHCYVCKQHLPLADFGVRRRSPDGKSLECRDCKREYRKTYKPTEATLARKAAWTAANRERVNEQAKAWYHRNRERVLAKDPAPNRARSLAWAEAHRADTREKARAWRRENKAHHNYLNARTRARRRAATCDCCKTKDAKVNFVLTYALARRLKMDVDHVRPLAKGGKHCLHNLQLLTPTDNRRKGAKWIPTSEAA